MQGRPKSAATVAVDAVLARAGFGDDSLLAHATSEQNLAQAVVDLVRSGVEQVFALDVDFRAAQFFAEAPGVIQRRRPACVVFQQVVEFRMERGVLFRFLIRLLDFLQRGHEDLRDVASAVRSEMARGVGLGSDHAASLSACNAA